jgi:hypothetical protein
MKKIAFITLALATVYTAPAFAQDSQALCKLMATYTPGVDVHGNAVVPADLKAAAGANDVIKIPVTIDLAKTLSQNLPAGTEMDAAVSMIEIHKDGKVMYNGQDVTQQASAVCASATAPAADATAQNDVAGEIDIPAPGAEETPPPADLSAPLIDTTPAPAPAVAPEPAPAPAVVIDAAPAPAPEAAPVEAAAPAPAPEEAAPAVEEAAAPAAEEPAKPAKPRYTEAMRKADQEATAAAEAAARAAVVNGTATMGTSAPSAPIGDGASAAPAVETGTVDHAASGGDFGENDPQVVGERAAMQAGVDLGSTVKASSDTAGSSSASVTTDVPPPAAAEEAAPAPAATEQKEDAIIWGEGN